MKILGSRKKPANNTRRSGWVLFSYNGKFVQNKKEYEASGQAAEAEAKTAKIIDYSAFLSWYNESKASDKADNDMSSPYGYPQKQKRLKFIV